MNKKVMIEAIANVADNIIFHITYDSVFFLYSGCLPGFILAGILCVFDDIQADSLLYIYILMMFSWYILVFIILCIVEYDELMNKKRYK